MLDAKLLKPPGNLYLTLNQNILIGTFEKRAPDQRSAKQTRPGHCRSEIHPECPGVPFLGTDTWLAQKIAYICSIPL